MIYGNKNKNLKNQVFLFSLSSILIYLLFINIVKIRELHCIVHNLLL